VFTKENLAKTSYSANITKTPIFKVGLHQCRGGTAVPPYTGGTAVPHGTVWPCHLCTSGTSWPCCFSVRFSNFRRVVRPTLAIRHCLLFVALPASLAFFKNKFWACFWAYLQIAYKALNKAN